MNINQVSMSDHTIHPRLRLSSGAAALASLAGGVELELAIELSWKWI
jgi:hypothetical protein